MDGFNCDAGCDKTSLQHSSLVIPNYSAEKTIPNTGCHTEIPILLAMMMLRVTQLDLVKERRLIQTPAMNSGMNNHVPKISDGQTRRDTACDVGSG